MMRPGCLAGAIAASLFAGLLVLGPMAAPAAAQFSLPSFFGLEKKTPRPRARLNRTKRTPIQSQPETVLPTLRPEHPEEQAQPAREANISDLPDGIPSAGSDAPLPAPRPATALPSAGDPVSSEVPADRQPEERQTAFVVPLPALAPDRKAAPHAAAPQTPVEPAPTRPDPQVLACLAGLKAQGAQFVLAASLSDPLGCHAVAPLNLAAIPSGVTLSPPALVNCDMAQAIAAWIGDAVMPAARANLGHDVTSLRIGASYVCRYQASGKKLSEHAYANAIDLMSFTFADGSVYTIGQTDAPDSKEARFIADVRRKACDHFNTVLGPGSNADHADHFHLDLRGRRGGYKLCE